MLNAQKFDSSWRAVSVIKRCSVAEAAPFLARHYLGKRPAIVMLCLEMVVAEATVGVIVYAQPPREASKRYGGVTWELARLFLDDSVPRNGESWLIAQSIRYIRKMHPEIKVLLSYADPSAGHCGYVYRASNWTSDGKTDQERKSPRCDYVDTRTGKKYGRRGNMPEDAIVGRIPRVSKYRYFYRL